MKVIARVRPACTCPHCKRLCKIDTYLWTVDACDHMESWGQWLMSDNAFGYLFYFRKQRKKYTWKCRALVVYSHDTGKNWVKETT